MGLAIPLAAKRILVVEDNPGHRELLQEALNQHGFGSAVQFEQDVDSASAWLHRQAASSQQVLPALVLLDLKLHGESGLRLLLRLRDDHQLAHLPVVVITTSDDQHDINACYAAGANGYVVKPGTFGGLTALVGDLCRYWLNWNRCKETVVSSGAHSL
jgi:CheY-like chemotaxis protein